jgi:hypothetical protein
MAHIGNGKEDRVGSRKTAVALIALVLSVLGSQVRSSNQLWSEPVVLHSNGHSFVLRAPAGTDFVTPEKASRLRCGDQVLLMPPVARTAGRIASIFPVGPVPREETYVAVDAHPGSTRQLLDEEIMATLADYEKAHPGLVALRWETATTGDHRSVPVAILRLVEQPGLYEAVAFIGEKEVVVRIGCWVHEVDGGWQHALEYVKGIVGTYARWNGDEGK